MTEERQEVEGQQEAEERQDADALFKPDPRLRWHWRPFRSPAPLRLTFEA